VSKDLDLVYAESGQMSSQSAAGLANEADVYADTAQHGKSHDNIIWADEMEHELADIET